MVSRRQFIQGTSGLAVGALLAGCTDTNSGPPSPPSSGGVSELPRPALGVSESEAQVTVKVFEDYMCPHCAEFTQTVQPEIEALIEDGEPVRFEFYDFPIPVSPQWSWRLAMAGRAIQDLGSENDFWMFHTRTFASENNSTDSFIQSVANIAGVSSSEVLHRTNNNIYQPVVMNDKETGQQLGISATPGVIVNGTHISNPTQSNVMNAIQGQL